MSTKIKLPIFILLLDVLGMALIGVGLAEHFAAVNWVPEALRFDYYAFLMIFFGFLLATPLVVWTIKNKAQFKNLENQDR